MLVNGFISVAIGTVMSLNGPMEPSGNLYTHPTDSATECRQQYSIFKENVKTKAFDYALPSYRYLMEKCPTVHPNLYIYGEKMMRHYIEKAEEEEVKQAWVDTLFIMLDQRLTVAESNSKFGTRGFILGKKVAYLSKYRKKETQTIYDLAKEVVGLNKKKTKASVMSYYMLYTAKLKSKGTFTCDEVIGVYNELSGYIDENLEQYEETDTVKYKNYIKAQNNIDKLAGSCLTCETLVDIYDKNYEQNKDNAKWINKAATVLDRKKCIKDHKDDESLQNIFVKNFEYFPTVDGAKKLAAMYVLLEKYDEAETYFSKATELSTDDHEKAKIFMLLASVQAQQGKYSKARSSALSAAKLRPKWGKPYIFIGDLYAGSMGRCKMENACESRAVFWAAVDKYSYAKSIDPNFKDIANKKIGISAANYPTKEDCFFISLSAGQSYKVGCWIQETTTVRTK